MPVPTPIVVSLQRSQFAEGLLTAERHHALFEERWRCVQHPRCSAFAGPKDLESVAQRPASPPVIGGVTLVFNIREGQVDGTDIGDLKVALIADTPRVMTEGNWRLGVFIDANATDEEFNKLVQLVEALVEVATAATGLIICGLSAMTSLCGSATSAVRCVAPFDNGVGDPVRTTPSA